jgi:hypothetical protein
VQVGVNALEERRGAASGAGGVEALSQAVLLRMAAVKRCLPFCRNTISLPSISMQKQWFAMRWRTERRLFCSAGTYRTGDSSTKHKDLFAGSNTTKSMPSLYTTWLFTTRMGMARGLSLVNQERWGLIREVAPVSAIQCASAGVLGEPARRMLALAASLVTLAPLDGTGEEGEAVAAWFVRWGFAALWLARRSSTAFCVSLRARSFL